ncbi:DedA family protein [Streptomyces sp. NPDC057616]|uniref:DedA family protein n=1 Tax=Streptomyces sp. NPDC057616 TaxID=3346183 RepID=UPI00368CF9EC
MERARDLLRGRGPAAVFVGRFVALLRSLMPAPAGASNLAYRRFLLQDALGGLLWGVGDVAVGHAAGAAFPRVKGVVGNTGALASAALVVVALVVWCIRRHRRSRTRHGHRMRRRSPERRPPGDRLSRGYP